MRVLMVHSRYRQRGGEDVAVDAEIAALRAAGVDVVPFFGDNNILTDKSAIAAGLHALWSTQTVQQLRHLIAETAPDVMHVHNTFPGLSASAYTATQGRRIPIVQTLHNFRLFCSNALLLREGEPCTRCLGAALPWRGIQFACYHESHAASAVVAVQSVIHRLLGARQVARYIALSQSSRELFIAGGLPAERITVKPNIIPDPGPHSSPDRSNAAAGSPAAAPRQGLLFVGRLSPEKGLDTVLAALHGMDVPLTVAGDGPQAAALQAASPPHVRWLGAVPPAEISRLMRQAALLVFPSRAFENYPMALAEAMAHGLPVLASDRGAMREMLQPGHTGWLVPPGDAVAWRDAITDLLRRPQDLAAAGQAARAHYLAHLAPARMVQRQLDIYQTAIGAAA